MDFDRRQSSGFQRVDREPVILPVPFGNDVFHALRHWRTCMQGFIIHRAIGLHIVPDQHHACLRANAYAQMWELRRAAFFRHIQEYHRGPTPLPASRSFLKPIVLARVEKIMVGLEFLAHLITLPLHRFGIIIVDAQYIAHPRLDLGNERVPTVQVAAIAGTETGLLGALVER